jgi:hypothetical protein
MRFEYNDDTYSLNLIKGENRLDVYWDDMAERDTAFLFRLICRDAGLGQAVPVRQGSLPLCFSDYEPPTEYAPWQRPGPDDLSFRLENSVYGVLSGSMRASLSVNGKSVVYEGYSKEGHVVIENVPEPRSIP